MRLALALLLVTGCTDYGLNHGAPGVVDPGEADPYAGDGDWWNEPFTEPPDGFTDAYGEDAWNVGTFPPEEGTEWTGETDDPNDDSWDPNSDGNGDGGSNDPNLGDFPDDDSDGFDDFDHPGGDGETSGGGGGGNNGNGGGGGDTTSDGGGGGGGGGGGSTGDPARMTGGGHIDELGLAVHQGFTVHCAGTHHANRMQIGWGNGDFHLEGVDWVACIDDPALDPSHPIIAFDTVVGQGWGRLNSGQTVDIWFKATDDGEPGTTDTFRIEIDTGVVPIYAEGILENGNHQAHGPIHWP